MCAFITPRVRVWVYGGVRECDVGWLPSPISTILSSGSLNRQQPGFPCRLPLSDTAEGNDPRNTSWRSTGRSRRFYSYRFLMNVPATMTATNSTPHQLASTDFLGP